MPTLIVTSHATAMSQGSLALFPGHAGGEKVSWYPLFAMCSHSQKKRSDISYLKTSQAFDVLIHSGKPNSVG